MPQKCCQDDNIKIMAYKNKVTSISIKGFKSIRDLTDFKLGNLNVMIGSNGAGKSNFISVFKMLNEVVEKRLQSYVKRSGGANKILAFGSKQSNFLEVSVKFEANSYWFKLSSTEEDSLYFEEEGCSGQGYQYAKPFDISLLSKNKDETGLDPKHGTIEASVYESIHSWKLYHFHDTSETSLMKKTGAVDDNARLKPDASNLAAYLYLLQQKYPQDFANITDTVKLIAPFFESFVLKPMELKPDSIQLEWRHRGSDNYFNVSSLSDGTLRFIALATLLLQPEERLPKTILLDEPELGLHPAAIQLIANMFKSTALRTQLIVSSQSVTLINQLEAESIIVVEHEHEQSNFRRLSKDELSSWLEDYGLGDMWEKNVIGGRP